MVLVDNGQSLVIGCWNGVAGAEALRCPEAITSGASQTPPEAPKIVLSIDYSMS